jgi:hypothetical protein
MGRKTKRRKGPWEGRIKDAKDPREEEGSRYPLRSFIKT